MYQLYINIPENDDFSTRMIPFIKEKLENRFPTVSMNVQYSKTETRPVFRGLKDGAVIFELKGIYLPSQIVDQFKDYVK